MKKPILFILILLVSACLYGQAPEKINYQAVVRNANGNTINSTSIPVTITISDGTNSYVYGPTNITTNSYGLINIEIGPIVDSPYDINWSNTLGWAIVEAYYD